MTPKRRKHLDLAGTVTKWVAILGAVVALMKQGQDLRASNAVLAGSVATVMQDGVGYSSRLARLERRIATLEGKRLRAGRAADAAPDSVTRRPGIVRRVGVGLWNLLFG